MELDRGKRQPCRQDATPVIGWPRLQARRRMSIGLHDSEDVVYGITPLLARALSLGPDQLPSLDLLSDMLMEVGAYEEAAEFVEKIMSLAPDNSAYRKKLTALASSEGNRRRTVRVYLHQKRQHLLKLADGAGDLG